MFKKLLSYFFNGLLITLPIGITIYLIYALFMFVDELIPLEDMWPGVRVIIVLAIITFMGFLGNTLIAIPIRNWAERMLNKVPLIKTVYTAITDLLSAFVGQKKSFSQPVLVKMNVNSNVEKIGFITDNDLEELGHIGGKVAVYFPLSYSLSGDLFIVPVENITYLDKNPTDVMKYIVSGGVSELKKEGSSNSEK